jgi:hypothetical protein
MGEYPKVNIILSLPYLPVWMVRCRRGQLMIYGFELLGFRSESREPVHSGPDHRMSVPYHTELSVRWKLNRKSIAVMNKKNKFFGFFSKQITKAVGNELANDLRVCLALSISDIRRAPVVPRLRAVPLILALVTM